MRDYGHDDQIGLEETPELYLKTMWSLFDDIKLKLKNTGTCWVNLGDTYWGGGNASGHTEDTVQFGSVHTLDKSYVTKPVAKGKHQYLQNKSLCLIPERFAWGMIERGWILRNKPIWHKVNHMPESVTDRFTKSYENLYFFTKQGKYNFNLDAVREPHKTVSIEIYQRSVTLGANAVQGKILQREEQNTGVPRTAPKWFREGNNPESFGSPRARASRKNDGTGTGTDGKGISTHSGNSLNHELGKNPGDVIKVDAEYTTYELIERWKQMHPEDWTQPHDVWQINTQPYADAHFAVFPIELVRRPILAGCPVGGHVLDPFGGSGTVAEFCRKNDRECTIFELNPEYESLIKERSMANYPTLEAYV